MIIKFKLEEARCCKRLLLAASVSGLLLAPVANAEQSASGSVPTPQGAWNPYAAPGAVPPPPGPYGPPPGAGGPRFRPDSDLEGSARTMPPGMPADFSDQAGRGSLTRQQFHEQQEAHRRQMDEYYQQREAEMKQRVDDMQKRMDAMQTQGAAGRDKRHEGMPPPAPEQAQVRDEAQQRWEQQKAEQARRWEQQKAEQQQRMQQMQAEHDRQLEHMKAQQQQRVQAWPQYRPMDKPAEPQSETAPAPAETQPAPQPAAPAYAYPQRGYGYPPQPYGYGYPPPPYGYGYGGPGGAYPQYPAPAAGGQQGTQ